MGRPRMTLPTQLVLRVLLDGPEDEQYGLQIAAGAGLATGTVHPILARLERLDWVESRWEDIDPSNEGRPARRYYRLTGVGHESARVALAQTRTPKRLPALNLNAIGETP